MRKLGLAVLVAAAAMVAADAALAGEIAKAGMQVYANSVNYQGERAAINNNANDYGWLANPGIQAWLIVDLGRRYTVETFRYQPRPADAVGRIKDYEICTNDAWLDPTADPATVLTPVAAGTWPNDNAAKDIAIGQACRYVILKGYNVQSADGRVGACEIYVFGVAATDVTAFEVKDAATLGTKIMNGNTVSVTQFVVDAAGETIDGYLITEEGDDPAVDDIRWQGSIPATYTIAGDPPAVAGRQVILKAWVRTASGKVVGSARKFIFLSPLALAEIPKDTSTWQLPVQDKIIARCSEVGYQNVRNAINGNWKDVGWLSRDVGAWLELDLGGRYNVGCLIFSTRYDEFDGRPRNYSIYISDIPNDPLSALSLNGQLMLSPSLAAIPIDLR